MQITLRNALLAAMLLVTLAIGVRLVSAREASPVSHGQVNDFQWSGVLAQGQTLEIRGVNGTVRAVASDDRTGRVEATRSARRSDPASVRIDVVEHAGGVTICAVYPTRRGARAQNECRAGGGTSNNENNDVQVDFVVQVPAGVHFTGTTANGNITAEGLRSDVNVTTVNGQVSVQTTGSAEATTVNGSITARLGHSRIAEDVRFTTVNGSITVEMPAGLNAELNATTVNGSVESDFPVLARSRASRRSLRGTIGDGGPELRMTTVNGSIRLRQI